MHRALLTLLLACGSGAPPAPLPEQRVAVQRIDAAPLAPADAMTAGESVDQDVHDDCERGAEQIVFSPPLPDARDERDFTVTLRRKAVHEACEEGSSNAVLAEALAAIDELVEKIAAVRRTGPTCTRVVAVHYADAKWRGQLDGFTARDRQRMIAGSRQRMTKACGVEAWSDLLRACIVVDGGPACFEVSRKGLAWGFPAAGTVTSLGIGDCDAYGAAIASITSCSKLPELSRQALRRSFDEMQAHLAGLPAAQRAKLASSCRAGRDAIEQARADAGC